MKKMLMIGLMMVFTLGMMAQQPAQIKFDKTTHNFGSFSEKNPARKHHSHSHRAL